MNDELRPGLCESCKFWNELADCECKNSPYYLEEVNHNCECKEWEHYDMEEKTKEETREEVIAEINDIYAKLKERELIGMTNVNPLASSPTIELAKVIPEVESNPESLRWIENGDLQSEDMNFARGVASGLLITALRLGRFGSVCKRVGGRAMKIINDAFDCECSGFIEFSNHEMMNAIAHREGKTRILCDRCGRVYDVEFHEIPVVKSVQPSGMLEDKQ